MAIQIVPGEFDPNTLPSLTRDQLLDKMDAPLKAEFRRIEATLKKGEEQSCASLHEIGGRVSRLLDTAKYGSRAVFLVAAAAGVMPRQLYHAAKFYKTFLDRKKVEKLMARRENGGYRITLSHLFELMSVDDATRRADLVELAFRERLTVRQFTDRIRELHRGTAGRPRAVLLPRTLAGGLNQLTAMTAKLREKVRTTLPECVVSGLTGLPTEQVDAAVVSRVARVREELAGLAREAAEGAAELARLEQELALRTREDAAEPRPAPEAEEVKVPSRPAVKRRTRRPVEA